MKAKVTIEHTFDVLEEQTGLNITCRYRFRFHDEQEAEVTREVKRSPDTGFTKAKDIEMNDVPNSVLEELRYAGNWIHRAGQR